MLVFLLWGFLAHVCVTVNSLVTSDQGPETPVICPAHLQVVTASRHLTLSEALSSLSQAKIYEREGVNV